VPTHIRRTRSSWWRPDICESYSLPTGTGGAETNEQRLKSNVTHLSEQDREDSLVVASHLPSQRHNKSTSTRRASRAATRTNLCLELVGETHDVCASQPLQLFSFPKQHRVDGARQELQVWCPLRGLLLHEHTKKLKECTPQVPAGRLSSAYLDVQFVEEHDGQLVVFRENQALRELKQCVQLSSTTWESALPSRPVTTTTRTGCASSSSSSTVIIADMGTEMTSLPVGTNSFATRPRP